MKLRIYILIFSFTLSLYPTQKKFVIIIPSFNNKFWFQRNLDSIACQNYTNYEAVYIDDASTDKTSDLVEAYLKDHKLTDKIKLIKNTENKGALNNLYTHIHKCDPKDIIITLDGDDWLAHEHVLEHLNNIYQDQNTWMTYGSHIDYPTYTHGSSHQLPQEIILNNKFRDYNFWATTHLRTFYAGLFQKIKLSDLLYNNIFYPMAWDCAFMFPMLEMAGMHSKFIPEILYIYNIATPLNDNKLNKELQCRLSEEIRKKEKYNPLERLFNEY